jgi:uncharacterized cupredoxin-like copper-binding protein
MNPPTTNRRQFQFALFALPWALHLPAAHAHGAMHGEAARAVVKEQKPWGIAGEPGAATRTIDIRMTDDMKLSPNHLEVREGETLRLRAINQGKLMHEIVLGTGAELRAHAEMMKKHPGMEHDEPYMAHVPAGKRGDIVWTFNRPGDFEFACLIAGHFEAGMRGTIRVQPKA